MRTRVLLIVIFCSCFIGVNETSACECRPESTSKAIKRLRKEATAIFVGTAKEVTKEKNGYRATFIVEKWWKGALTKEMEIRTSGGCMNWFETGHTYLIYASPDNEGRLSTNICMRTGPIKYAAEDLKRLGRPKPPNDARAHPKPRSICRAIAYVVTNDSQVKQTERQMEAAGTTRRQHSRSGCRWTSTAARQSMRSISLPNRTTIAIPLSPKRLQL